MQKHTTSALALVLASAIGAPVLVPASSAADHRAVSGTWSTTPLDPTGFSTAGANIKLPGIVASTWSGDLSGTTIATATFLVHPDGRIVAAPSRETLTGTVAGHGTGTLDLAEEAHAGADGSTEIAGTIVRGTGDLTGLHGRLTFLGTCDTTGACTGTYSGFIS